MFALLLILSTHKPAGVIDRCDMLELNHICRIEEGRKVIQIGAYLLAWDWCVRDQEMHCADWAPAERTKYLGLRNMEHRMLVWTRTGRLMLVAAPLYRETWTTYDPEIRDRQRFPTEDRRRLFAEAQP